jgi:hypothetical protein
MTNATIIKIADKRSVIVLISLVFILVANCLAEKPIVNYCLHTEEKGSYIKFESIIDSSVFAKLDERNIWQIDSEEGDVFKAYFIKIEGYDSMYCYKQDIHKKYSFILKNMVLQAYLGVGHGPSITSNTPSGSHASCLIFSNNKYIPCSLSTSNSFEKNSTTSPSDCRCTRSEALTEIAIDFPESDEMIRDSFRLNGIKSSFGDTIPVSWEFKIRCPPHSDTTITGKYFVRITGECKK